jgi:mRNA interferase RelE/StbE
MDKIQKALKKLSPKEHEKIRQILRQLESGKITGFDLKKLKGRNDIFRVRKGDFRIIYKLGASGKIFILAIERRKESTYK